jgi:hypothetical protein
MELQEYEKQCYEYCKRHLFPYCEEYDNCDIRRRAEGKTDKSLWQKIVDSIRM